MRDLRHAAEPTRGRRTARAPHEHGHGHDTAGWTATRPSLQQKVLAKNDDLAERNRDWLRDRGILAVNLMSSPGSGKTTLLERTARTWPAG